jgi:hypothetical protein
VTGGGLLLKREGEEDQEDDGSLWRSSTLNSLWTRYMINQRHSKMGKKEVTKERPNGNMVYNSQDHQISSLTSY